MAENRLLALAVIIVLSVAFGGGYCLAEQLYQQGNTTISTSENTTTMTKTHEWPVGPTDVKCVGPTPISGLEGEWYVAGLFNTNGNCTYSVRFKSVMFTFLYYSHPDEWDVPYPVKIRIVFQEGIEETIGITIGGNVVNTPFVYQASHTNPPAAIVSHNNTTHNEWYGWYYLVST
jgi:hypothetical protein